MAAAAGLLLAVLGSLPPAQAAEANPAIDPRAARIVQAALRNIAAAKSLSLRAEVTREVPADSGQRIQHLGVQKVYLQRPDRFTALYQGEDRTVGMYYDGKLFTLANPTENVYATWEAPATVSEVFEKMKEKLGFVPPLAVLLHDQAGAGDNLKNILSGTYVGRASVRGVECHHVAIVGKNVDWQAWVAEGEPIIQRIVVTFKRQPLAPQFTATFTDWDFDARLSDYLFAFDPPPGARKIEFKVAEKP